MLNYLEGDILSREIVGQDSNRSSSISTKLLSIGTRIRSSIMPFYNRYIPSLSLKCYVRFRHGNLHLLSAPSISPYIPPPKIKLIHQKRIYWLLSINISKKLYVFFLSNILIATFINLSVEYIIYSKFKFRLFQ
jgi:hypothetical protein